MICNFCKKEIDDDSLFCKYCAKPTEKEFIEIRINSAIERFPYKIKLSNVETYRDVFLYLYKKWIIPKSKKCLESAVLCNNKNSIFFKDNADDKIDSSVLYNGVSFTLFYEEDENVMMIGKKVQYLYGCPPSKKSQ